MIWVVMAIMWLSVVVGLSGGGIERKLERIAKALEALADTDKGD